MAGAGEMTAKVIIAADAAAASSQLRAFGATAKEVLSGTGADLLAAANSAKVFDDKVRAAAATQQDHTAAARELGMAITGIGAAGLFAVKGMVGMAGAMQQSRIAFGVLTGGAEHATKFLSELQQFSAETSFEFPQLQEIAKRMKAMGVETGQVIPRLRILGDAMAALGAGSDVLNRVVISLGQMELRGKAGAEELRELTMAGVPAMDILAKKFNMTGAALAKAMEKGAIGGKEAVAAILEGLQEKFGGIMEKQKGTLVQVMSNLGENSKMMMAELGEGLVGSVSLVANAVSALIGFIRGMPEGWKAAAANVFAFGSVAMAAIGPLMLTLPTIIASIGLLQKAWAAMSASILLSPLGIVLGAVALSVGLIGKACLDAKAASDNLQSSLEKLPTSMGGTKGVNVGAKPGEKEDPTQQTVLERNAKAIRELEEQQKAIEDVNAAMLGAWGLVMGGEGKEWAYGTEPGKEYLGGEALRERMKQYRENAEEIKRLNDEIGQVGTSTLVIDPEGVTAKVAEDAATLKTRLDAEAAALKEVAPLVEKYNDAWKQAGKSVQDAKDAVSDAQTSLDEAFTKAADNAAKAYDTWQKAIDAKADATVAAADREKDAIERVEDAQEKANEALLTGEERALAKLGSAQEKLASLQEKEWLKTATPEEKAALQEQKDRQEWEKAVAEEDRAQKEVAGFETQIDKRGIVRPPEELEADRIAREGDKAVQEARDALKKVQIDNEKQLAEASERVADAEKAYNKAVEDGVKIIREAYQKREEAVNKYAETVVAANTKMEDSYNKLATAQRKAGVPEDKVLTKEGAAAGGQAAAGAQAQQVANVAAGANQIVVNVEGNIYGDEALRQKIREGAQEAFRGVVKQGVLAGGPQ